MTLRVGRPRSSPSPSGYVARLGVGPDGLQRLREDPQGSAGDNLCRLDCWAGTASRLRDMATNIGITNQGKDPNLRHLGEGDQQSQ